MTDHNQPRRSLGIKNLMPGLVERGKIKIGNKGAERQKQGGGGTYQMPQKLDHFLITTMRRGQDGNFERDEAVHKRLGDKPQQIPVVMLYDDIELNFQTRYACYNGRQLWCSGDGETARRMTKPAQAGQGNQPPQPAQYAEVQCPCHRQAPDYTGRDKCKINGNLSVMIQDVDVIGGVWKFRTTSYNSVVGILSSLALIKRITGGPLAGIPLMMTVNPKSVTDPVQGSQQTVYVVGLEYRGRINTLQEAGHNVLLGRLQHNMRIEHIEEEARRLISHQPERFAAPDDVADDLEEFYPEQLEGAATVVTDDGLEGDLMPVNDSAPATAAPAGASDLEAMASGYTPPADEPLTVETPPAPEGKPAAEPAATPRRGRRPAAPQPAAAAPAQPAATAADESPKPATGGAGRVLF